MKKLYLFCRETLAPIFSKSSASNGKIEPQHNQKQTTLQKIMIGGNCKLSSTTSMGWRPFDASVAIHRVDKLPRALPHCPTLALSGGGGGAIPLRGSGLLLGRGRWRDNEIGVMGSSIWEGETVVHWVVSSGSGLWGSGGGEKKCGHTGWRMMPRARCQGHDAKGTVFLGESVAWGSGRGGRTRGNDEEWPYWQCQRDMTAVGQELGGYGEKIIQWQWDGWWLHKQCHQGQSCGDGHCGQ